MSWSVLFKAWPIWSEPVMLGGGMTMEKGGPVGLYSGRKYPRSIQKGYHRFSVTAESYVLSSAICECERGSSLFGRAEPPWVCERGESNPHGCLAHRILNPARLPIPPLSRRAKSGTYRVPGPRRSLSVVIFVVVRNSIPLSRRPAELCMNTATRRSLQDSRCYSGQPLIFQRVR
jgi:hypothetical protein